MKEMQGYMMVLVLICRLMIDKKGRKKEMMEIEGYLTVVAIFAILGFTIEVRRWR